MGRYKKKPVVIEAFKWMGDEHQIKDMEWARKAIEQGTMWFNFSGMEVIELEIKTLEGNHIAHIGDYVIQGVKGEIYPCKSDIFELTYEKVEQKEIKKVIIFDSDEDRLVSEIQKGSVNFDYLISDNAIEWGSKFGYIHMVEMED